MSALEEYPQGVNRVSIQVRMLPREDVADPNLARDALCVRARAFLASPTWIDRRRRKERRASPRREVRHKNFNSVVLGGREQGRVYKATLSNDCPAFVLEGSDR